MKRLLGHITFRFLVPFFFVWFKERVAKRRVDVLFLPCLGRAVEHDTILEDVPAALMVWRFARVFFYT